ncbi:uncharacterized protein SAPINGB_P005846 [Magnusiomyces paraingens]|uniref:Nucleolar complex protein 2 n=1 Tax=Magnusiomyces paraingens TaxID=2606893 RepID=A0A5E8C3Y6_9ASCO|nr:uncharacterized protein SAPINGB_P005846 [Saprochaete ingens]VVT57740.1 unnamed protein product [Saprochaete ingens]
MALGKSTKKFQKNHLKRTIDQRKAEQSYKKKVLHGKEKKKEDRYVDEEAEEEKKKKRAENSKGIFENGEAESYFEQDVNEDLEILKSKEPTSDKTSSEKKEKKKNPKKSISKDQDDMKESLGSLKDTDPEFYKYLKENDEGLLDFDLKNLESDDEGDEEEDSSGVEENDDYSEDEGDEVDEGYSDDDIPDANLQEITVADVEKWKKDLVSNNSLSTLKEVIQALKDAIDSSSNVESSKAKYVISDPNVFNGLLRLSLVQIPETIQHHIPLSTSSSGAKHISGENKKLAALSAPLKNLANCLVTILSDVTDKAVAGLVLKSLSEMLPYFLTFGKQIKAQIDVVAKLWGTTEDDETRLYAFAFLKTTAENHSVLLEPILKATYSSLIKYSKQSNIHTMGGINFQKNSAATLYGLDGNLSYRLGFQYIRQLAVHLRSSLTNKTPDSYKIVYNWQYVHSLDFWARVLSYECDISKTALRGSVSPLQELIYPLVQVTLGTIRLIPTAQYFPLRFYLIRSLIGLSQTTGVYIPIVPLITEIFNSTVITKSPKGSSLKALDFEYNIRASKSYLGTKIYQEGVCDQITDLLGEFFALHCKSIAFPELAIPVIITLRRFTKRSKNGKFNKQLLRLVERLEENSKFIQQKRNHVNFGPRNRAEVAVFLKDYAWEKTPIGNYVTVQRQVREERIKLLREAALEESNNGKKPATDLAVGSFESDEEGDDAHDRSDVEYSSDEEVEDEEKEDDDVEMSD